MIKELAYTKMFEYADPYGIVLNEAIIGELITNCNDAGILID